MAIFPFHPGISVQILNEDDKPLQEYRDTEPIESQHPDPTIAQHHNLRTVSNYVESSTQTQFKIRLCVEPPYNMGGDAKLRFEINIDGNLAAVRYCGRPEYKRNGKWSDIIESINTWEAGRGKTGSKGRKFAFAEIESTEDLSHEIIQKQKQRLSRIGKITVSVFRSTCGARGGPSESTFGGFLRKRSDNKVHEKAMKGDSKSHGTYLEKAKKGKRPLTFKNTRKKDGDDMPMVIFQFLYRSNESLRKLLVIDQNENEGSPTPTEMLDRVINLRDFKPHIAMKVEDFVASLKDNAQAPQMHPPTQYSFLDDEDISFSECRPAKRARTIPDDRNVVDLSLYDDGDEDGETNTMYSENLSRRRVFIDIDDDNDDGEVEYISRPRAYARYQATVEDAVEENGLSNNGENTLFVY
ncbi:hypothetical protein F5884DRAFT_856603 [Xylogone sp. PMI_703]|nr:hypothetical protein F5884DRAFT_856603 [Xylogone sp. PMI_703]